MNDTEKDREQTEPRGAAKLTERGWMCVTVLLTLICAALLSFGLLLMAGAR